MATAMHLGGQPLPRAGGFVEEETLDPFASYSRPEETAGQLSSQPPLSARGPQAPSKPNVVLINVYELFAFGHMNRITAPESLNLGGAFHVGVVVYGREWSYGGGSLRSSGLVCEPPRSNRQHRFRETLVMGKTPLSESQVSLILSGLMREWLPGDYHWLHRNCLAFANEFCQRLGVGRIPAWIDRFARGAGAVDRGVRGFAEGVHEVAEGAVGVVMALLGGGGTSCGQCTSSASTLSRCRGGDTGMGQSQATTARCRPLRAMRSDTDDMLAHRVGVAPDAFYACGEDDARLRQRSMSQATQISANCSRAPSESFRSGALDEVTAPMSLFSSRATSIDTEVQQATHGFAKGSNNWDGFQRHGQTTGDCFDNKDSVLADLHSGGRGGAPAGSNLNLRLPCGQQQCSRPATPLTSRHGTPLPARSRRGTPLPVHLPETPRASLHDSLKPSVGWSDTSFVIAASQCPTPSRALTSSPAAHEC